MASVAAIARQGMGIGSGYSPYSGSASLKAYEKAAKEAKAANEARYQEAMGIYDQIISQYQPGGQFGQGALAQYEIGKTKALSQGMQNLVSSGLSNTTVAGAMPMQYEQEVGTPFRLQLEDMRMRLLSEAQQNKAGLIERRQDVYPDPNLMANLQSQASSYRGGGMQLIGALGPTIGPVKSLSA